MCCGEVTVWGVLPPAIAARVVTLCLTCTVRCLRLGTALMIALLKRVLLNARTVLWLRCRFFFCSHRIAFARCTTANALDKCIDSVPHVSSPGFCRLLHIFRQFPASPFSQ